MPARHGSTSSNGSNGRPMSPMAKAGGTIAKKTASLPKGASLKGAADTLARDRPVSLARRTISKVSEVILEEDATAIDLGGIAADYIGTVPVKGAVGHVMCRDAVERMEKLTLPTKLVEIRVTTNHIWLIEKKKARSNEEV